MIRRAFVLGGGVAGLVAAFGLAERGFAVTLCESRGWLGGRAFAAIDKATGHALDNGPHVMLGCYRAMRALLRRIGTEDLFQQDATLALAYRWEGGRVARLALPRLPVPFAMPPALLRLQVPFGAKLRALWGMGNVLLGGRGDVALAAWLRARGQHGAPTDVLWQPLCRAIMNVEPELAAAGDFFATLREAFLGSAAHAAFWVPRASWSEIVGEPAAVALAAAGVDVRTGFRIAALELAAGRIRAITGGGGERIAVAAHDVVVSAMPWFALAKVLPRADGGTWPFAGLPASPIVSAYFELAPTVPPLADDGPVTALPAGDPFHFVVRTPGADVRRFALLAGGNRAFDGMPVAAIETAARAQLARLYPGFDAAAPATVRIRKEALATFVAAPGSQPLRPPPGPLRDGPANLLVCGDWTATGLPATLEGAARSAAAMLRTVPAE